MAQNDKAKEELIGHIRLLQESITKLGIRDINLDKILETILASELKYRTLVEMTGTGYLILDSHGRVLDANQEYVRISGHEKLSDIIGKSVVGWTADGAKARNAEAVEQCLREGFIKNFLTEYSTGPSKITFVEINATVEGEGDSLRLISLCRDVTRRMNTEIALKESEKRFLDVLYASQDAILLIDGNIFVDCNEATAKMLGYKTRKEFLMTHPSKLSPDTQPDGRKSFEKAEEMMSIATDKGYNRFEWVHRRATGEDFLVEVSLTPIALYGRTVIHCIWRDLTEMKRIEKAERQHLRELEIFYKAAMDREDRIMELKEEVKSLKKKLGI